MDTPVVAVQGQVEPLPVIRAVVIDLDALPEHLRDGAAVHPERWRPLDVQRPPHLESTAGGMSERRVRRARCPVDIVARTNSVEMFASK